MLSQADGTRYKYDVEGNLTEKHLPKGQGSFYYQWDSAGQLVRVKRPDGYAVQFQYDALGRRTHKLFQGKLTRWVWDGDTPLHEWSEYTVGTEAGSVDEVITWLFEPDSFAPLARLTPSQRLSVVTDHLGTPLELVDEQGGVAWGAQLDSYGRIRQGTGKASLCPFRYQGQYEDGETGLYYNRFRYYSPQEGTYISQDPISIIGGIHLYSYVSDGNTRIDPNGLADEGDVHRYHRYGREAHELLRNKYLEDNGLTTGRRHPGNPSIALSPGNHDIAHAEEFRLRRARGLGNNDMMKRGRHEIRLASQAIRNTLVQSGAVTMQQLRTARRYAENFAKRLGCY